MKSFLLIKINEILARHIPAYKKTFVDDVVSSVISLVDNEAQSILEIPCLCGNLSRELVKYADLTSIDISKRSTNYARNKIEKKYLARFKTYNMDITNIKCINGKYDIAVVTNLLYFLKDPFMALNNISHKIRRNGYILITDLNEKTLWPTNEFKYLLKNSEENNKGVLIWKRLNDIFNRYSGIKQIQPRYQIAEYLRNNKFEILIDREIFFGAGYRILARK